MYLISSCTFFNLKIFSTFRNNIFQTFTLMCINIQMKRSAVILVENMLDIFFAHYFEELVLFIQGLYLITGDSRSSFMNSAE